MGKNTKASELAFRRTIPVKLNKANKINSSYKSQSKRQLRKKNYGIDLLTRASMIE